MICLYIQTSIFDGQIVTRCKWDNVASGQFRFVTWFSQRLSTSLRRAERDILMDRRWKSSDVSKFEINVRSRFYRTRTDQTRHFFWASSSWQRRSTTRKSWHYDINWRRISASMYRRFSLTTWICVKWTGRRGSHPSTLHFQFLSACSNAPRFSNSSLLGSFLWRNARSPDDECGRHQVFSRNDGIYAHHEDRKINTEQKVMFFRHVKRATLTRYGNKRVEYFFATRHSVWTALALLENSMLTIFLQNVSRSLVRSRRNRSIKTVKENVWEADKFEHVESLVWAVENDAVCCKFQTSVPYCLNSCGKKKGIE